MVNVCRLVEYVDQKLLSTCPVAYDSHTFTSQAASKLFSPLGSVNKSSFIICLESWYVWELGNVQSSGRRDEKVRGFGEDLSGGKVFDLDHPLVDVIRPSR